MFNLVPKWPFVAGALVLGLVAGAGGMRTWDSSAIDGLQVQIAQIKAKNAESVAAQSQAALSDLATASRAIKEAASTGQAGISALSAKLDTIDRRYRNAKPPAPLPVDCKPGVDRVRQLTDSAAAVNEAIARPVSGK